MKEELKELIEDFREYIADEIEYNGIIAVGFATLIILLLIGFVGGIVIVLMKLILLMLPTWIKVIIFSIIVLSIIGTFLVLNFGSKERKL